jgi:hypothetical protein
MLFRYVDGDPTMKVELKAATGMPIATLITWSRSSIQPRSETRATRRMAR